jgi:hypothetical protein
VVPLDAGDHAERDGCSRRRGGSGRGPRPRSRDGVRHAARHAHDGCQVAGGRVLRVRRGRPRRDVAVVAHVDSEVAQPGSRARGRAGRPARAPGRRGGCRRWSARPARRTGPRPADLRRHASTQRRTRPRPVCACSRSISSDACAFVEVVGHLLARLAGQGGEVAALRPSSRLVAGHPLSRLLGSRLGSCPGRGRLLRRRLGHDGHARTRCAEVARWRVRCRDVHTATADGAERRRSRRRTAGCSRRSRASRTTSRAARAGCPAGASAPPHAHRPQRGQRHPAVPAPHGTRSSDQYPAGPKQREARDRGRRGRPAAELVADVRESALACERAAAELPDDAWGPPRPLGRRPAHTMRRVIAEPDPRGRAAPRRPRARLRAHRLAAGLRARRARPRARPHDRALDPAVFLGWLSGRGQAPELPPGPDLRELRSVAQRTLWSGAGAAAWP